ncbi:TPA: hypothetical protein N0F65_010234 [Lagenidium giganteum]|uniref:Uncharacterized protein n=1 Tax=Lagenidium giganteum TaxID=4803 RepID=A0AAV2YYC4_9STRA|nr:TPA: hypothetical protein N0F65_010234 [Lagenidium giganteum]
MDRAVTVVFESAHVHQRAVTNDDDNTNNTSDNNNSTSDDINNKVLLPSLGVVEPTVVTAVATYFNAPAAQLVAVRPESSTSTFVITVGTTIQAQPMNLKLYFQIPSPQANAGTTIDAQALTKAVNAQIALLSGVAATMTIDTASIAARFVSSTEWASLGPFAALVTVPPPAANTPYMTVTVTFRNLAGPSYLPRTVVLQMRQAIATFLSVTLSQVVTVSPPANPTNNVLLVQQSFYLLLQDPTVTMARRKKLANLLIYGDPSRQISDSTSTPGTTMQRPSMVVDYVPQANSALTLSVPLDKRLSLPLAYIFNSLTVDQFPAGNPPAPTPTPIPASSIIPAMSAAEFLAQARKRQRFRFDLDQAAALPATLSLAYPTLVTASTPSTCGVGEFCTSVYWKNSLDMTFWLESIESVEQLSCNLYPGLSMCATLATEPTKAGGLVPPGNATAPIWLFKALTGFTLSRLEFALNLLSTDNNGTSLKVEITTEVLSSMEASTTVTSIAQDKNKQISIFQSKSNVVVSYDTLFRNGNEILLFLEIKKSTITQKDRSQPCAHCQNLFDYCGNQPKCAALASCVFDNGLLAAQVPTTLLTSGKIGDVRDVSTYFRTCLGDPAIDFNALVLFSSIVRCQSQRMCPYKTSKETGDSTGQRILLWDSVEGTQTLQTPATNTHFLPTVGVAVRVGLAGVNLCNFTLFNNVSTAFLVDRFHRRCKFANYFGFVSANVQLTGRDPPVNGAGGPNSFDTVGWSFKFLVGPMPSVDIVQPADIPGVITTTTTLPSIRLRLENKDYNTVLPPSPATAIEADCARCHRLAMDTCMRDPKCAVFTDCMVRSRASSTGASSMLGDQLTKLFKASKVNDVLDITAAIDACHSLDMVNQAAWRKFVNASACYSYHQCPVSLPLLFPKATTAAQLVLSPTSAVQTLIYSAAGPTADGSSTTASGTTSSTSSTSVRVPMQLTKDGVVTTASSSLDPLDLQTQLQTLVGYQHINVTLTRDTSTDPTNTAPRTISWTVSYKHWVGKLPQFLPTTATDSGQWTLVSIAQTPPRSVSLLMVPLTPTPAPVAAVAVDSTSSTTTTTTAAAATTVSTGTAPSTASTSTKIK